MNEATKPTETNAAKEKAAFLATSAVLIKIYNPDVLGLSEPIVLHCKIMLNQKAVELRQKFYAQDPGKIAAGQHNYHCEHLDMIVTKVEGLPGFDGSETIGQYLASDPTNEKLQWIAAKGVDTYYIKTQNQEFL